HEQVGTLRGQPLVDLVAPDRRRGDRLETEAGRRTRDRRGGKVTAPAPLLLGLRDDERGRATRADERVGRGYGPVRRTEEKERHGPVMAGSGHSPVFWSLRILRLIRSRFKALIRLMNVAPSRWSISWQSARARSPSPTISYGLPSWSRALTRAQA